MLLFLLQAAAVSLSGVLAPGPVTAATIAAGTRSRHAGILVALGHGVVEFPLMLLILLGVGAVFKHEGVKIAIGLVGGGFLIHLGIQMIRDLRKIGDASYQPAARGAVWTGILLSGGNPYFLLWWATVGLALATKASEFGVLAFALFALVHWLCDLVWLEVLSWTSFRGSKLFSGRVQRIVLILCAGTMLFFGGFFIHDAVSKLLSFR
ncbi:MAG: LysE family transporter [Phycisphaerae bacterium]|nr:LysE family transporter [Phycisphaerae bacterium]